MTKSTLSARNQTTVPKEVREKLGVGPGDTLTWEVVGDQVRVTAESLAIRKLKGIFTVGPGDPVEDVRKARELMGC
jgi:AbrB family looped-hinge helix DNA binding protein